MRELLIDAAERAIQYLESLNERAVVPDATVVARLTELKIPLPDHPSSAGETVALLDSYAAATMAIAGPRFFGGVMLRGRSALLQPFSKMAPVGAAGPSGRGKRPCVSA